MLNNTCISFLFVAGSNRQKPYFYQMDNKTISRTFKLLSQLMDLHEENSFKIKSITNASFKIDKLPFPIAGKTSSEIEVIEGIGKSTASKVIELLQTGSLSELTLLLANTPPGVVEMLTMKGIGPKKIGIIWKQLQIETIGELYYACNENRLIEAKGFGLKTQNEIKKAIEFRMASNGKFLYAKIEDYASQLKTALSGWLNNIGQSHAQLGIVGEFRRANEIISELGFLIGSDDEMAIVTQIDSFTELAFVHTNNQNFAATNENGLVITLTVVGKKDFYRELFIRTGNTEHVNEILKRAEQDHFTSEEEIYQKAGLDFVVPELREHLGEIELAKKHQLPTLITLQDLKGTLHNHSTWSDGVNTLEEMALFCRDVLKLEYLGISDHSKSAFYAKGLEEHRVLAQHEEIDALNKKLAPFKIFKGIESDILYDGGLDYGNEILDRFDFVVASVHSQLKMPIEKATQRLITAIENPYTTILGHPTGRLLLARKGYEIDYKKVIDACAANQVVIEINANPLRLDLDWRWHRYALEKGVLLSINPDAHRNEGFGDMRYGVLVGRKGGLSAGQCLNALSLDEIEVCFKKRKASISC